jgi:predicted nucleic acid-binding protein
MAALELNLRLPGHHFWHDSVQLGDVFQLVGKRLIGHRQVTDAYLFALAVHHRGVLATMDESIRSLGSSSAVEVIPT